MQLQVWVLDDAYSKVALITRYRKLEYTQRLNGIGYATLEMHANDAKIADLSLMRRLKIIRDGEIVFGGLLLRESWEVPDVSPQDEVWKVHALDHGCYAQWRVIVPASGSGYDTRTDHADDLAKAYVRAHVGLNAAERWFPDLAVAPDQHLAASLTERGRYGAVLTMLEKLADKGSFDWRFVPTATGCLFKTAYPQWGVDRTKGNGINDEAVFSLDRRNFSVMSYSRDLLAHSNFVYVGGQGTEEDRTIVTCENTTYTAAYKRREAFADARHLTLTSSLTAYGNAEIVAQRPAETMTIQPASGTWKVLWDLGDLVTIYAELAGRTFEMDGKITGVNVTVTPDELETVKPTVEAVS